MESKAADRPHTRMHAGEVKHRATSGAAILAMRGSAVRGIGFAGNIALARLLVPEDFGLVALGLAVTQFGALVASGGLAIALVGRREPPSRSELESLLGLQLAIMLAIAAATVVVATIVIPDARAAAVTALIACALPITAFRAPPAIEFERRLSFRPIATVEVAEVLAYYGWAIALTIAGWGVWGLASASLAQAVVGSVLMVGAARRRVLRPRLGWGRLRPLFGFGMRFQAVSFVNMLREQGLVIGTAALAGVSTAGLWTLAWRILRVPNLLFESLWRVAYPANSRLLNTDEDPRPLLERGVALVALVAGAILTFLVASTPALVPAVFGEAWEPITWVIPPAALGILLNGPLRLAVSGFLWAVGDASTVLRNTILGNATNLAVGLALVAPLGVVALGIGWLAAAIVSALRLSRAMKAHYRRSLFRPVILMAATATIAASIGWAISSQGPATLWSALAGGLTAEALFLAAVATWRADVLREAWRLGSRGFRGAFSSGSHVPA
jgi:O-antigen/teichoic acid export membrane protein